MLLALRLHSKQAIEAPIATRADGPFQCLDCQEPVSLRKGTVKLPHFSHTPQSRCEFGKGETDLHRRCKTELFAALRCHPKVTAVHLEYRLGKVRPDVFANVKGVPVAFELQISNLTPEAITRRTEEYRRLGIYVLWLLPWTPKLNRRDYSPRRFERWIHAAYFGRVYFWTEGLTIVPYHFETHKTHMPRQRFHNKRGEEVVVSSHTRYSKRFKRLQRGKHLDLITDFAPKERRPWRAGSLSIPRANIFADNYNSFPIQDEPDLAL